MTGIMSHRNDVIADASLTDLGAHLADCCKYFQRLMIFVRELTPLEYRLLVRLDLFGKKLQTLAFVELSIIDVGRQAQYFADRAGVS